MMRYFNEFNVCNYYAIVRWRTSEYQSPHIVAPDRFLPFSVSMQSFISQPVVVHDVFNPARSL